jgi:hypothetical protein
LRVDGIGGVGVGDGGNGLNLLALLGLELRIVELDIALENGYLRTVVGRSLLHLLLELGVLLLIGWRDNAPAASPGNTSTKTNSDPVSDFESGSLHDDVDVIEQLSLACDEGTSVGLLECRVLVHGETNAGCPLNKRVVRVEVQQVSVPTGGGDAEDIL